MAAPEIVKILVQPVIIFFFEMMFPFQCSYVAATYGQDTALLFAIAMILFDENDIFKANITGYTAHVQFWNMLLF